MRGILLVAAWSGARWALALRVEDEPHLLSIETENQSTELQPTFFAFTITSDLHQPVPVHSRPLLFDTCSWSVRDCILR